MTVAEIIVKFNLYTGDSTELSDDEEIDLFNKVLGKIGMNRPWESLKTQVSGTILSTGGIYYITLPTDFGFLLENNMSSDNTVATDNNASPKVIFVGADYAAYQVVNFSDRRQHRDKGYAYLDLANDRIAFTGDPSADGTTYEFDYCKTPATLATGDTPDFPPAQFHEMIAHLMAVDEFMMEQFPKAQSYASENLEKFEGYLRDLIYWNSQLQV